MPSPQLRPTRDEPAARLVPPTGTDVPPTGADVPAAGTDVPAAGTDVPAAGTDVPAPPDGPELTTLETVMVPTMVGKWKKQKNPIVPAVLN